MTREGAKYRVEWQSHFLILRAPGALITENTVYQLYKSKYEKSFFGKMIMVMLFHIYPVFSSQLGHLHFSLHFFFTFMEQLFNNHPIPKPNIRHSYMQCKKYEQKRGMTES